MQKFVTYRRVSTQKQGQSGLGLEAQERLIADYLSRVPGEIVATFTEVESGRRSDRPELRKALAAARRHKAVLLVAKLDRLARSVSFVSALLDTPGVEFRAADLPEANRMMLQMLSVFAEYEARLVSERTRAALAARRARGFELGTPANLMRGGSPAPTINRARAKAEAERLRPVIESLKAAGVKTVRGIASELNDRGYLTERGSAWHPTTAARVLARLGC